MAAVIACALDATATGPIYAQVRDTATGAIWNGSAFVTYNTSNISQYQINMTQQGSASRYYTASFPSAIPAGVYAVLVLMQVSATPSTPSESDATIDGGLFDWDGSVTVSLYSRLAPTTAGRTLDVSAGGEAGIDWSNIGSPTATVAFTNTTIAIVTTTTTATTVSTVNGLANGVITANSIAADAITDAKVASDVTIFAVTGSVGSIGTGGITAGSFASNAITATAIAADAIGASELAADAVAEIAAAIVSGGVITVTGGGVTVAGYASGQTPLQPTVAGRTLDVSTTGEAGIDWANIGSPTTSQNLSGTSVKTATDVETDTQDIQSRLPAALISGRIDATVGAMQTDTITAGAIAADAITEIQSGLSTLTQSDIRTAVGLASANLDTQLADLPTASENATAYLDFADAIEVGMTPRQSQRLILAASAGKLAGAATTTVTIRNTADTKTRITATVDADGNRTAVSTDVT